MSNLLEVAVKYFETDQWPYTVLNNQMGVRTGFQGDNGKWTCLLRVMDDQQQVAFYSVFPIDVPENKRVDVALFLTRANYGLIIGNFEMDLDDGEVRFKTSLDMEDTALTPELLRALIINNVGITDKYLPGVMAVIYGNKSLEDALSDIENSN